MRDGAIKRRTGRLASWAALALATVVVALVALPAALGMRRYVIVSGSMTGTYDRGSLVFDEVAGTAALRPGDVITYRPPPQAGVDHVITHRIASIRTVHGMRVFRTKGDANPAADPWSFRLTGGRQARVRWSLPYAGFAFAALADPKLRIWLLSVPAGLIALGSLASLWRRLGAEAAARAAAGRAQA
ncbi:MAG: signal peptidase [Solirubrobacteraceae bacterium]|jgi:signal peptidase|nr:signal peptidase [Solirubrobacteraceae bacterium]